MTSIADILANALRHHRAGRLREAEEGYRAVLAAEPANADASHLLGMIAHQTGDDEAAVSLIGRAIAGAASVADFHHSLGLALAGLQRHGEAADSYRRAVALRPEEAASWLNLGAALAACGAHEEALAAYRRVLGLEPGNYQAMFNIGAALLEQGEADQAIGWLRRAAELPGFADAWSMLGNALLARERNEEALAAQRRAVACGAARPDLLYNLGIALQAAGQGGEAVDAYRAAVALDPALAAAHNNLGNVLKDLGRLEEAARSYRAAIAARPDFALAQTNLGNLLRGQGQLDAAIGAYEEAIRLAPDFAQAHGNLLLCLHYLPGITASELDRRHRAWDARHGASSHALRQPFANARAPERRLRLGFLSGDFARHPIGFLALRGLENLDRERVEVWCYSARVKGDDRTARFRATADGWREVAGWPIERLAETIRADGIDILFDLAGHADIHMPLFARKPAPIQVSWAGYVGTTGLRAMDALLADRFQIAPGTEASYGERIVTLPHSYICYDPPEYAPPVTALPALARGFVTFGCFNNPAKLNPPFLAMAAAVLAQIEGARLVLRYGGMDDSVNRARVAAAFAAAGVAMERVEMLGGAPHSTLLEAYGGIDIALDTFPYSGGLTTCEALWMGVPVVTWPGETFAGRHSFSHLANAGLVENVADGPQGIVARAVELAGDWTALAELRAGMRQRVAASHLCDGPGFARALAAACRSLWRSYCAVK